MGKLIYQNDSGMRIEQTINNKHNAVTIGRNTDSIIYTENDTVSRDHAVIRWMNGNYEIEDRKSTNHTKINDGPKLVPYKSFPLRVGDIVTCGKFKIWVDSDEEPATLPKNQTEFEEMQNQIRALTKFQEFHQNCAEQINLLKKQNQINQNTIDMYDDKQKKLKEALTHLQSQLEHYRKENQKKSDENNHILKQVEAQRKQLGKKAEIASKNQKENRKLKVQIGQLTSKLEDTKKELNLLHFNEQKGKDELEILKKDNDFQLTDLENLEKSKIALGKVIEEHENNIDDLHFQIKQKDNQINSLKNHLKGSDDRTKLVQEITSLKNTVGIQKRENKIFESKVRELESKLLKISDITIPVEKYREIKSQLQEMKDKNQLLTRQLKEQHQTDSAGDLQKHISTLYSTLNNTLSAFKGDIYSVRGYLNSLDMVITELEKCDLTNFQISSKLIELIEEIDLTYTRDELTLLVDGCVKYSDSLKRSLLKFHKLVFTQTNP